MGSITEARAELRKTKVRIADAERDRDNAQQALDHELAVIGWHRAGVLSPTAEPRYENPVYVGTFFSVDEIVRHLEAQKAALA